MPVDQSFEDEKNNFLQQNLERDRQREHADPAFQADKEQFLKAYGQKTYTPEEEPSKPTIEAATTPIARINQSFGEIPLSPLERINQSFEDVPRARYVEGPDGAPRWMPPSESDRRFDYMMKHLDNPENFINALSIFSLMGGTGGRAATIAGSLAKTGYNLGKGAVFLDVAGHSPTIMHLLERFVP